ncbi:hypothetical protein TTHERM_00388570 (macronuclear) [Tetrahymena thermophila SB210]|uniref:Tetratricopeptide repeat protein n=1 Tax=Tetrahymena thermophila (strain SB210) TaxID=312017 RepID=Q23RD2_TETTS|nr:hypothetical protein TTHERM_00388570 [Tetrahymena thermophila SB210]EAR99116.2 hypothetical protein TTHERM_00388570 [Tetrahymena thermophila SB210]|eukprot:XP_001019361.2 hypothetical protein TTHERM_00388570 [Tetrahymena thermophila SB210]
MNQILKFINRQQALSYQVAVRKYQRKNVFYFCSNQFDHSQNSRNQNIFLLNNLTSFLPKDYHYLLPQFQSLSYHQLMDQLIKVQQKEQYGQMNSNDLNSAQLSFLFSRILFYRQEYDQAIQILYFLNKTISEQYLNPSSPNYERLKQTDHNLNLTNSLLEMSQIFGIVGDQDSQQEYVDQAEEQFIEFLGTQEQKLEVSLKFLQSYRDLQDFDMVKEYENKIINLLDSLDNSPQFYPIYKNMLNYFEDTHQKQSLFTLGQKMIQIFSKYDELKQDIQGTVIPLLQQELNYSTFEGKKIREDIQVQKLEMRNSNTSRRQIQEIISKVSKLKYEKKYDDAIELSEQLLHKIMNDLPNQIPSDMLLICFNNLFVLYSCKNNNEKSAEYGQKWIKLTEKLQLPSHIVLSKSSVSTFYLKIQKLDEAQKNIDGAVQVLKQNPNCVDLTDRFITLCLQFQISFLNQQIPYEKAEENLQEALSLLEKLISENNVSSILHNKVVEMYTFLKSNQLKLLLKQIGNAYLKIKQLQKDFSLSYMDYIVYQDLTELSFIEKNYDESIRHVYQAIKIYEQLKSNQKHKGQDYDLTKKPRWVVLQYIKACIEVNRGDIDKGFQAINKYQGHSKQEESQSQAIKESHILQIQNNQKNYWSSRLQAETFFKLGQYNLAFNSINQALKYVQIIQDINLQKNTFEFKQQIKQFIPESQLIKDELIEVHRNQQQIAPN